MSSHRLATLNDYMSDYFRPSHKDSAGQTPPFEWCEDKRKEGEICHASLPPIVARVRDQSNQSSVDPWSTPDRHASIPERRRRRCRRTDAPPRTDQGAGLLVGVARLRDRGVDWGTVIASMKVGQARFPGSLRHAYETQTLEENRSPPAALRLLLRRYVAGRSGCAFCVDRTGISHGTLLRLLRVLLGGGFLEGLH